MPIVKEKEIDLEDLMKVKNLKEFHEKFTVKIFGFKDVNDYFLRANITEEHLLGIKIPTLCLHSKDDPISTRKSIPFDMLTKNENLILAETSYGGHVCWFSGIKPKRVINY